MPYAECPKCKNQNEIETTTDGQGLWCAKCGVMFKAHQYRISLTKGGAKLAEAKMV